MSSDVWDEALQKVLIISYQDIEFQLLNLHTNLARTHIHITTHTEARVQSTDS